MKNDQENKTTVASLSPGASTIVEAEVEDVIVKSAGGVRESNIDPMLLSSSKRPNSKEYNVKEGVAEIEVESTEQHDPLYIEFEQGDLRNPINFTRSKKWAITALACFSTLLA
ncbi:hypothetical protein EV368DRAFT_69013, partial [Lentinula lateritia]